MCGSEQLKRRRKNREVKQSKGEKKPFKNIFRNKRSIGLFALTVFVLVAVPSIAIPFALRDQFQGVLLLQSVNIFQYDPNYDTLEIWMSVSQGRVSIKCVSLFSVDRLTGYQVNLFDMELERDDYFATAFIIDKDMPPLTDGIALLIEFKDKEQWITYLF